MQQSVLLYRHVYILAKVSFEKETELTDSVTSV